MQVATPNKAMLYAQQAESDRFSVAWQFQICHKWRH